MTVKLDIKYLISKVEVLGLDTQPLRDFYNLLSQPNLSYTPYLHTLATLKNQVSKSFSPNSKPTAIALLLKQLDKKIKNKAHLTEAVSENPQSSDSSSLNINDLKGIIEDTVRSMSGKTVDLNKELLRAVDTLNSNVKGLKQTDSYKDRVGTQDKEMEAVFVNPIDEKKVDNIKGTLNIGTKRGSNIKNKIDRLKKLSKSK